MIHTNKPIGETYYTLSQISQWDMQKPGEFKVYRGSGDKVYQYAVHRQVNVTPKHAAYTVVTVAEVCKSPELLKIIENLK